MASKTCLYKAFHAKFLRQLISLNKIETHVPGESPGESPRDNYCCEIRQKHLKS